ncbi:hypothetical protein AGOR_G00008310 [Albula goreensis]|uniref:Uncharacterized protein n=1 Tax=Albula goreensis TaxID=1534307 RepID=A0A8T3E5H3_9TELE|nr:hypothetical protein AGOR_G00008310 [Albula goreensis]
MRFVWTTTEKTPPEKPGQNSPGINWLASGAVKERLRWSTELEWWTRKATDTEITGSSSNDPNTRLSPELRQD